ncbi:hypothetical protein C8R44DRAFT_67480 [Mycena epipterygia]|nr:hypothetical protein C8R44DRAFT_67480 [Mycena epipterygia]
MMSGELPTSVALAGPRTGADTAQLPELPTGSSRLNHLLESNDLPLDSEIPAIRPIIIVIHARVEALDSQIEILRTTMERLVAERDEWQECVRKHTAVMAPLRRAPSELIREIFALTLPHTRRFDGFPVNCPPWRFGHTCRSWRDSALADPFLWRSIELSDEHRRF